MGLYEILEKLNIDYEEVSHQAVFTVKEAKEKVKINGLGTKSIFLKNKNGDFYLLILSEEKRADLKKIAHTINSTRLSFASPQELKEILGLEAGGVTPFGIINDKNGSVFLIIDSDLKNKKLLFHPNVNTKTISISFEDLIRVVEYLKCEFIIIECD